MTFQPYTYDGLEPMYIDLAKKELNEDTKKIAAHIASLRNWLQQSRHIQNFPADDAILLRFLRVAKFNHEAAQSRLENFCTLRGSSLRGVPNAFNFPAFDDSKLQRLLQLGFQIPCGFNDRGELVIIVTFGCWNPDEMSYTELAPYLWMGFEVILSEQRCQIAGVTAILDLNGISKKHIDSMFADKQLMKNNMRIFQEASPLRNREIYYYREPLIFDIIFNVMKLWMKPKLLKRLHRVKGDLQKIHDKMPGAKKILPKEYGGENGTLEELKQKWRDRVSEYFSKPNPMRDLKVDESLRPADTLKFLKEYKDAPENMYGTQGTFTKVDAE